MSTEVNGIIVAAHELKAPLSLLRQLALSLDLVQDDQVTERRLKSQLVQVSERAIQQVNDLTKIARLEDNIYATEPVSVRAVCCAVHRDLDRLYHYEGRALQMRFANKSKLAIANPELLYGVVYNFCVNALHYSAPDTASQLSIHDRDQKIRISVRDFGPALPTEVWQQFVTGNYRAPTAIPMRPGSSGLGLYIATQFARHMHADLRATRHRDGTSFAIELPISQQASFWGDA